MSYLIADVDRSLSSIGGTIGATKLSGLPPVPISHGFSQLNRVMRKFTIRGEREITHPLLGKTKEPFVELTPLAKEHNLQGLVTDTISVAGTQEIQLITAPKADQKDKDGRLVTENNPMEIQDWGTVGRRGESYMLLNSMLPIWSVVLCHYSYEKDGQSGIMFWGPSVPGNVLKDIMPKLFDVILVSKTVHVKGKNSTFTWITKPDNQCPAKDRLGVLPQEMPQDFGLVFKAYADAGDLIPKILVLGRSGTGKTFSLKTIPKQFCNGHQSTIIPTN